MSADKVRSSRGISREIWESRPYTRWTPDDLEPLEEAYEGLSDGQMAFIKMLGRQEPGWIINRHAVSGAPHVYPEIRPDGPVRTGPDTMHWHGTGDPADVELPPKKNGEPGKWAPAGGWRVMRRGTEAYENHVRKINESDSEPDTEHEAHEDPHIHKNLAKYVFPVAEKAEEEWWHDHSAKTYTKSADALQRHLKHYHAGTVETREDGKHRHVRRIKSKDSLARRLDIHPMALPLLEDARRVYFGLEGCLKADSILSAIMREGRPESVFSVPSVSLWEAPAFDSFARRCLRGKQVVVVPDADWFDKRLVLMHARFAQRFLRHRGVEALIAAPPLTSGHKGVDDFLGAGGSLDDLEVLDRADAQILESILEYRRPAMRLDGFRTAAAMIKDLAFFADHYGEVQVSHRTMANILGCARRTVAEKLERMQEFAWIEVEQREKDEWVQQDGLVKEKNGYVDAHGNFFYGPLEFKMKTLVRVHPELRCKDLEPRPLGIAAEFSLV